MPFGGTLMCQLKPTHAIADRVELRIGGLQKTVDRDVAAIVDRDAGLFQSDVAGLRGATDRDQQLLAAQDSAVVEPHRDLSSAVVGDRFELAAAQHAHAFLFQEALEIAGGAIVQRREDAWEYLYDRDRAAER